MSILYFYHKNHLTPNFRLIRYASVSTIDQNTDLQTDALKLVGCHKIFIDKTNGVKLKERTKIVSGLVRSFNFTLKGICPKLK